MNEQLVENQSKVIWPNTSVVEVGPETDFVYIIRKDAVFAMSPIAEALAADSGIEQNQVLSALIEEYEVFFASLSETMKWGYASKGNFELHVFDPEQLEAKTREIAGRKPIISLDPLLNTGVHNFQVSRGYYLSGTKDFSQVARPGSQGLSMQADAIAMQLLGQSAVVAEDDIFSGGSVIASLQALLESGVSIHSIVSGIQIGKPKKLSDMGLVVNPVIEYRTSDGTDLFDKVDLGDPRDYLVGASGLVVKLPNNVYGRAPYILPFVSTTARAGIPALKEQEFAQRILQANHDFFMSVEHTLGKPLLLKYMNPSFVSLMKQMYNIDGDTTMTHLTTWLMDNINELWEITKQQGAVQERMAHLCLPHTIVFIDVNGTLIPEDSQDGSMNLDEVEQLKILIVDLAKKGVCVGLCSDSPLPELIAFGQKVGISGPILAENGNILEHVGQTLRLQELENIAQHKRFIQGIATNCGFSQASDTVASEFGGDGGIKSKEHWCFGAHRDTSISVFGPEELIKQLGIEYEGQNIDCNPEHNFFALHPGTSFKTNKGKSLKFLDQFGHKIYMIGNSMSDWVNPNEGVQCAFVQGSKITSEVHNSAMYVSPKPLMQGVNDILEKML